MIVVVTGGRTFGEGKKGETQKRFLRGVMNDLDQAPRVARSEDGGVK